MTDAEREERIRAEERARVLREQEEKARQEKLDNTLASLSTGLEEFRSGLSQLRQASGVLEQGLTATAEEISALRAESKPVELEPIREGLAGIRAMIPENFCEKFPELCTLLERPAEAKGPEHETAKEFLECSECSPSFAQAASGRSWRISVRNSLRYAPCLSGQLRQRGQSTRRQRSSSSARSATPHLLRPLQGLARLHSSPNEASG